MCVCVCVRESCVHVLTYGVYSTCSNYLVWSSLDVCIGVIWQYVETFSKVHFFLAGELLQAARQQGLWENKE